LSTQAALLPFYGAASVASYSVMELNRQALIRSYGAYRHAQLELSGRIPAVMDFEGDPVQDTVLEHLGYSAYILSMEQLIQDTDEYFKGLFLAYHNAHEHLQHITKYVYDEVVDCVSESITMIISLFAAVVVVFLLLIYFTAIKSLKQITIENERTTIMLMMIPQDVLVTVPEIRGYMQRHSEQKDRYVELEQNQLEQMRKDMQRLQEQNRIQNQLVNSMLPEHIARQLAQGKTVKPERYKAVSVLFSDIVGFTTLCGQLDPIKVMGMLNKLFVRFDKLTKLHGLFKVETIGDAYMVVGGIPEQVPDHAQKCSAMALDMIESVSDFQMTMDDGTKMPLRIRVGLNSGSVVASVVGDIRCNPRYCLFGDTVNTASRMESTGVPMKIQCTQNTADLIKDDYILEERGQVEVKGKGMMKTYFVIKKIGSVSHSHLPIVRQLEANNEQLPLPGQTN
jgi:class 3 adenylate cyclase